jgi:hypothetical protein
VAEILKSAFGVCFGITNDYGIIPMKVVEIKQEQKGGSIFAITKMICESNEDLNGEFKYHEYGKLYLNEKGLPINGNIYLTRLAATNHWLIWAEKEKEKYNSYIDDINSKIDKLKKEVSCNNIPSKIKNIISKISDTKYP